MQPGETVQEVDLSELEPKLVMVDETTTVNSNVVFQSDIDVEQNIDVTMINNIEINAQNLPATASHTSDLDKFNASIRTQRSMIDSLSSAVENVHQSVLYFSHAQDILLPYTSTSLAVGQDADNAMYLVAAAVSDPDGNFCANTTMFVCTTEIGNFTEAYKFVTSGVSDVQLLTTSSALVMHTVTNRRDACDSTDKYNRKAYSVVQSAVSSIVTNFDYVSTHIDIEYKSENVATLITQYFDPTNQSTCAYQVFEFPGYPTTSMYSCSTVKSVILAAGASKSTVVLLNTDDAGNRQVEIVDIYANGTTEVRQSMVQYVANDVLGYTTSDGSFLAVANTYQSSEGSLEVSYTVSVVIYKKSLSGSFELYQKLNIAGGVYLKHFNYGVYTYLAVATYSQQIIIFKDKGFSKWVSEITIPVQGYGGVRDMEFWTDSRGNLKLAVLCHNTWNPDYLTAIKIATAELSALIEGHEIQEEIERL